MTAATTPDSLFLPSWADDIRRPSPNSVLYWKSVGLTTVSDSNVNTVIAVAQRGPGAPVHVVIGDQHYTLSEATDLVTDALWAIRLVQAVSWT